ncbi:MAG: transposase [Planctomycetes bacterium]|nr:transposase [Planctomycetota bacterium]
MFLDGWLKRAMRSRLEPIKKVARSIRAHDRLILSWFATRQECSSGIAEGLHNKVTLTIRKAYGFGELTSAEVALSHALAKLPEPKLAHEFC